MKSLVQHNQSPAEKQSRYTVLLVCVAVLGFLVLLSSRWRERQMVKHVVVEGCHLIEEQEILDCAALGIDSLSMAEIKPQEVLQRVMVHPFVQHASVSVQTGETIVITIEERRPVASLLMGDASVRYIDAEAVVLPHRFTEQVLDIPLLTGFAVGTTAVDTVQLQRAVALVEQLHTVDKKLYRGISEIAVQDNGNIVLRTTDRAIPILFGQCEETEQKIAKLSAYWNTQVFHGDIPDVTYIDVRWRDQVVVGEKKNI